MWPFGVLPGVSAQQYRQAYFDFENWSGQQEHRGSPNAPDGHIQAIRAEWKNSGFRLVNIVF